MECNFHSLPPHKRFKLTFELTPTLSCLPAKKRKQIVEGSTPGSGSDSDSLPFPPNSNPIDPASICLPAKKRIWAFHPFDLNQDYQPTDQKPPQIVETEPIEPDESKEDGNNSNDDDGIVCAVCGSTDGDPTDPIVLCDGCDLMVHVTCYGNPFTKSGIPEGDWFCTQCSASKSTQVSCCLCPNPGGALKPTVDGKWAHLVCAVYVPEVFFEDWEGREGIDCSKVLERRWKGGCYVCGARNQGCVVDCSEPRCGLRFHVSCGVKEELCIEYRQGRCKDGRGGVVAAFCKSHTDLWKKQEQTGKFKIVAREEEKK